MVSLNDSNGTKLNIMAIKNLATLKQQFSDFINRIAPFDGDPLIQKTEHLSVEGDFFDSALLRADTEQSINLPSAAIPLDFSVADLYNIDSSASIPTVFTITINNLPTGQVARISIIKKTNDTYSFSNAAIQGVTNISQAGAAINFYVHNVGGTLVATSDKTTLKSDSTNSNNSDQIATSKAVRDLNVNLSSDVSALGSSKADKNQGSWTSVSFVNGWAGNLSYRVDQFGIAHVDGYVTSTGASAQTVANGLPIPITSASSASEWLIWYDVDAPFSQRGFYLQINNAGRLFASAGVPIPRNYTFSVSYRVS